MISKDAVWFITGCSRGLGRALAQQTLTSGYRVAVTALRTADVADIVAEHSDRALAVELDVTKTDQIQAAVTAAENRFGSVDVLVNNAGYGYLGAIEEGDDGDVRMMFETDMFAPVNLIKAVLPGMRARPRPHRQYQLARGFCDRSGGRLLPHGEVRDRGAVGDPRKGGGSVRHRRDGGGARPDSDRFPGGLHETG